ncbi:MAG TPA: hypothetical protein VE152_04060 [Acidimicrobiales bacterium]|nr:hypothetical protein [Acidimicrobiales bacterium]
MPKDRDQLTPDEPDDEELLEHTRGQGRAGTGRDEVPEDRSAPGGASGSGVPRARDEVDTEDKSRYQ